MRSFSQILVNTLTGWGAVVARSLINFLIVPFLVGKLGEAGYGLIGLVGVLMTLTGIADLGLRSALSRELSEKVALNDADGFRELCSTAFFLYTVISLVIAFFFFVEAHWIVEVFKVTPALSREAVTVLRTYGVFSVIVGFILPVTSAALSSFMRFDAINIMQTVSGALSALMLWVLLKFFKFNPVYVWAWVMALVMAFTFASQWVLFRRWCFGGKVGLRYLNFAQLKPLFHVGGYMYVGQLASMISEQSNPLIISYFLGNSKVSFYQPGYSISSPVQSIVSTLSTQLHPLTTRYHTEKNERRMQDVLLLGTRFTLLLGALFSAGLVVFAEPFARLWLWKSLGDGCSTVARVIQLCAIIDFLSYCGGAQWPVLLGMKRLSFILWSNVPAALLTIALSVYFVGYTSLGIPGVLIGVIITRFLRNFILVNYTPRFVGLTPWQYFRRAIAVPCLCLGWTILVGIAVRSLLPNISTWPALVMSAIATGMGWLFAAILIGLEKSERDRLVKGIQSKWLRFS